MKTLWQKEKVFVLSNFFIGHYVFKKLSAAEASESVSLRERVNRTWKQKGKLLMMNLFSFFHIVFKPRLLQRCQIASVCEKGLIRIIQAYSFGKKVSYHNHQTYFEILLGIWAALQLTKAHDMEKILIKTFWEVKYEK